MSLGAYDIFEATGNLGEPNWTDADLAQLLEIAFGPSMIDSSDHPFRCKLWGVS